MISNIVAPTVWEGLPPATAAGAPLTVPQRSGFICALSTVVPGKTGLHVCLFTASSAAEFDAAGFQPKFVAACRRWMPALVLIGYWALFNVLTFVALQYLPGEVAQQKLSMTHTVVKRKPHSPHSSTDR